VKPAHEEAIYREREEVKVTPLGRGQWKALKRASVWQCLIMRK
jgi:hypothetical protein